MHQGRFRREPALFAVQRRIPPVDGKDSQLQTPLRRGAAMDARRHAAAPPHSERTAIPKKIKVDMIRLR